MRYRKLQTYTSKYKKLTQLRLDGYFFFFTDVAEVKNTDFVMRITRKLFNRIKALC